MKSQRLAATAGATAYGHMRSVRYIRVPRMAISAITANSSAAPIASAATAAEKMTVTRIEPRYSGSVRIVRKFSSQTNSVWRPKGSWSKTE
jgi:hypothetical protein